MHIFIPGATFFWVRIKISTGLLIKRVIREELQACASEHQIYY